LASAHKMIVAEMNSRWAAHSALLATITILVLSIALMWFRTVPVISADEIGYLGNARWLVTGSGPSMGYTNFYYGGYSLLLAPFEWLLHEPRLVYKAVIVINAVFVAATVPALLRIARDFGFPTDPRTPWLAALVALWPAQFIQAYLALPEVAVRLCFLVIVVGAFGLIRSGGWHYAVVVDALAITCFAMHPRMVVVIPPCLLIVFIAKWRGQIGWGAVAVAVVIVAGGYFAIDAFNKMLQEALWVTRLTMSNVFKSMVAAIIGDPLAMIVRTFGHFWYQVASSLLMVALGAIVATHCMLSNDELPKRLVAALVLFAAVAVGVLGAASMLDWDQLDFLVYGRYLDIVTPTLFWFGLLATCSSDWRGKLAKWVPWIATASVLGGGILYYFYARIAAGHSLNVVEVGAFMPVLRGLPLGNDATRLFLIAPLASVIAGVLCFAVSARFGRLFLALGAVIGFTTTAIEVFYLYANHGGEVSTAAAAELYAKANRGTIRLDRSSAGGSVYIHQFMLKMHFPVTDVLTEPPKAGTVVTIGPLAIRSVSGECLGAIDKADLLVRIGDGDPTHCPP
jgi:hypothetical protein